MLDRTNRNTALAGAIVGELARCGARRAFISPGSRSAPLALALHRSDEIESTVVLDERSAAFAALGASLAEGRPSVVLCTSGSAAANLHPAVVEADESAVGLILLTADRPPELRGIGAGQTIDQLKLFGDAVRWFCELGTPEADDEGLLHARTVACRAFAQAAGDPRPGPVHVNVPLREPLAPLAPAAAGEQVTAQAALALEGRGRRPLITFERDEPRPSPATLKSCEEMLLGAGRVAIIAGRRRPNGAEAAIVELARRLGAPLLAEPTSQLRDHEPGAPGVVRAYDAICSAAPASLAPEVVLRFGETPTSKTLRGWLAGLEARQVVIDPTHGFHDPARGAELVLRCGERDLAEALVKSAAAGGAGQELASTWAEAERAAQAAIDETLALGEGSLSEPGVHRALGGLYAAGDLVYTASSMPIRDQEAYLGPTAAATFLANRGVNGIDGLVSSAAGAAIASGRPTWIVVGDLGLDYDIAGLALAATAARGGVPVRVVVLHNDGGGIFAHLPVADAVSGEEFEALFATPQGRSLEAAAAWAGIEHVRVTGTAELERAASSSALLEVPLDRQADRGLRAAVRTAVSAALS